MKKWISGLLALAMVLGLCAGCGEKATEPSGIYYEITGIDPGETVMEVDGNKIPAEFYLYWLAYACGNTEYQINMLNAYYGAYSELLGENGELLWNNELSEGKTLTAQVKEDGENSVLFYATIENMAAQRGVTLTDEDKADMAAALEQNLEQYGGEEAFQDNLRRMGISRETFDRINGDTYLFEHLRESVLDPESDLYSDFAGNVYVDHILLMTVNQETNEPLSQEEIAQKRALAEDHLSQLQAAGGNTETLFNELVAEHGEDQGRSAESGYLMNAETNFVQEFKDAALSLEVGQISDIVESSYGYHILLRKDLTDAQKADLAGDHLSALLQERITAAQVTRSEKLADIDAGTFYTSYNAILDAENAAQGEDQTSGEGGEGSGADAGGTDGGDAQGSAGE